MSHWRAVAGVHGIRQDDIRHEEDIGYYGGWTISGLAVLATIGAVWVFGL